MDGRSSDWVEGYQAAQARADRLEDALHRINKELEVYQLHSSPTSQFKCALRAYRICQEVLESAEPVSEKLPNRHSLCGRRHPYELPVRRSDDKLMCLFCCWGDRCDDPTHHDRKSCPHCHGTGALPDEVVT